MVWTGRFSLSIFLLEESAKKTTGDESRHSVTNKNWEEKTADQQDRVDTYLRSTPDTTFYDYKMSLDCPNVLKNGERHN